MEAPQIHWLNGYRDLCVLIVRSKDVHEGYWRLNFEMNLQACELDLNNGGVRPTVVAQVNKIGIIRVPESRANDPMVVDAALENPRGGIILPGRFPRA